MESEVMWVPNGSESNERLRRALAIPLSGGSVGDKTLIARDVYLDSLQHMIHDLIMADPDEAQGAMEMSLDYLPELYSIAKANQPGSWAGSILWSDTLNAAINRFDFGKPGTIEAFEDRDLCSILEQL